MENYINEHETKEYLLSDKIGRFISNCSESLDSNISNELIDILNHENCFVVDLPIFKIDGWICSIEELNITMIQTALEKGNEVYLCRFDLKDSNIIRGVLRDEKFELKRKIETESTLLKYTKYLQAQLGDKSYLPYEAWKDLIKDLTTALYGKSS